MLTQQRHNDTRRPNQPGAASRRPARTPRTRPLILLAEDDVHDSEIYGKTLWYNGYDVIHGGDGEAALELARRHAPDLVLVDLLLPRMNGIDLCRQLRDDPAFRDVPLIALTARAEREFGLLARDAGCSGYLEKPIGPFAVLEAVERMIGRAPPPVEDEDQTSSRPSRPSRPSRAARPTRDHWMA
jgi:CheY-like chemotaxis protein